MIVMTYLYLSTSVLPYWATHPPNSSRQTLLQTSLVQGERYYHSCAFPLSRRRTPYCLPKSSNKKQRKQLLAEKCACIARNSPIIYRNLSCELIAQTYQIGDIHAGSVNSKPIQHANGFIFRGGGEFEEKRTLVCVALIRVQITFTLWIQ